MANETILASAEFNRSVKAYWLLSGAILCVVTIVGILVLPIWLIVGNFLTERYLQNMSCTLTEKSLKVSRGLLVRQEKTVPLDKITDLGLVEGPIMRFMDLQSLSIETAGQSGPGALVSLVGIENTRGFRDMVLAQRDKVASGRAADEVPSALPSSSGDQALLSEIRDVLVRIEQKLPTE